jgi:hypothetical protein
MIFVKILLILVLTISFLVFAFSLKLKNFQMLGVIFGYVTLFTFIIDPSLSDKVAHLLGIGTGASLITYITIGLLSLIAIILFVDTKTNNDAITKIVRKIGIDDAKKC